jgi:hypothetical protein
MPFKIQISLLLMAEFLFRIICIKDNHKAIIDQIDDYQIAPEAGLFCSGDPVIHLINKISF